MQCAAKIQIRGIDARAPTLEIPILAPTLSMLTHNPPRGHSDLNGRYRRYKPQCDYYLLLDCEMNILSSHALGYNLGKTAFIYHFYAVSLGLRQTQQQN